MAHDDGIEAQHWRCVTEPLEGHERGGILRAVQALRDQGTADGVAAAEALRRAVALMA